MTPYQIKYIVQSGKLSVYHIGGGFLQVQYKTPELEQDEFWLFKFTSLDSKLVSVEKVKTNAFSMSILKNSVPFMEQLLKMR